MSRFHRAPSAPQSAIISNKQSRSAAGGPASSPSCSGSSRARRRSSSTATTAGVSAGSQRRGRPCALPGICSDARDHCAITAFRSLQGRSGMDRNNSLSRRGLLAGAGAIGAATLASRRAAAQAQPAPNAQLGSPASTITTPPRDWRPGHPSIYPDPDVIVIDPEFNTVRLGNAAIRRLWTGANWAEGPAWSSQGQYLVFSDVTGNIQYRYIWEDGRVTPFRRPSNNTNGNSFDFQGRQLSCEDLFRRVVRWEHDGSMTVVADSFQGK